MAVFRLRVTPLLLLLLYVAKLTRSHAYIQQVVAGGLVYPGFRPDEPYFVPVQPYVSWTYNKSDRGFVKDYEDPDIICHRLATPAVASVPIMSGEKIRLIWSHWPPHQGPVISYLAACDGPCEQVEKASLRFFKIEELGLVDPNGFRPDGALTGRWALDQLRAQNDSWEVTIPNGLPPGGYLLRHEAINLDNDRDRAQHYPQCVNLEIRGDYARPAPEGVIGTRLYHKGEPGLVFDIYQINQAYFTYPMPGPPAPIW